MNVWCFSQVPRNRAIDRKNKQRSWVKHFIVFNDKKLIQFSVGIWKEQWENTSSQIHVLLNKINNKMHKRLYHYGILHLIFSNRLGKTSACLHQGNYILQFFSLQCTFINKVESLGAEFSHFSLSGIVYRLPSLFLSILELFNFATYRPLDYFHRLFLHHFLCSEWNQFVCLLSGNF